MTNRRKRYIAFENRNLDYLEWEVETLEQMVKQGHDIPEIAKAIKRNLVETTLLYLDRVDRNRLEPKHCFVQIRKVAKA